MPELPEVENVAVALRDHLTGRELSGLKVRNDAVLGQSGTATRKALVGRVLADVHRHGKYLILNFSDGKRPDTHLMIHLRMTGQIFILDDYVPDKHVHLIFDFHGLLVHYRDIRKFGRLDLVDHGTHPSAIAHVGPDMLVVRFQQWHERIAHRRAPLKALLLDQGIASGLGNIYVDETLFLAGINPLAKPVDLSRDELHEIWRRAKQVLRNSIKHGGTTFMNFKNFHGKPGNFRRKLRVYGRAGEECGHCGAVIQGIRISGRSSCFCPCCQFLSED
jgi:formamidopyrimidine-DNA glycosylase